jgi:hypothetical protein
MIGHLEVQDGSRPDSGERTGARLVLRSFEHRAHRFDNVGFDMLASGSPGRQMIFDGQCMNLRPPTFHSDVPMVRDGLEADDVVLAKLQLLVKVAEVDREEPYPAGMIHVDTKTGDTDGFSVLVGGLWCREDRSQNTHCDGLISSRFGLGRLVRMRTKKGWLCHCCGTPRDK